MILELIGLKVEEQEEIYSFGKKKKKKKRPKKEKAEVWQRRKEAIILAP